MLTLRMDMEKILSMYIIQDAELVSLKKISV